MPSRGLHGPIHRKEAVKILLIGTGYIGSMFVWQIQSAGKHLVQVFHHTEVRDLLGAIWNNRFENCVVINCAAYVKDGRADACEDNKADTLIGNLVLPSRIADVCHVSKVPLLHVSTACLYNGSKDGNGWTECDPPQLSWRTRNDCGSYVASKQLAEEVVSQSCDAWIARVRLPFDNVDHPRNFISKIRNYPKVYDNVNSLAHRGEFVSACLQMIEKRVPFGTYNVLNQGSIWAHDICDMMNRIPSLARKFVYWDEDEFMRDVAKTPKSNCTLSVKKLLSTGIHMRCVVQAVEESIRNWE